ncbi:MAG: hypothetical protein Tsb0017_25250 [Geothermobacteraceae bacterium]
MTTLAFPYYGNIYLNNSGFEHVYFIANYDSNERKAKNIRIDIWDEKQSPDFCTWLKENNVNAIVCFDKQETPLIRRTRDFGIKVVGKESEYALELAEKTNI